MTTAISLVYQSETLLDNVLFCDG